MGARTAVVAVRFMVIGIAAVVVGLSAGCGSGDSATQLTQASGAEDGEESTAEYRVVLGNALSDTLSGNADFGIVVEPATGTYRFVIRLATGFDFAGGIIIARSDTTLPQTGDYNIRTSTDTLTAGQPGEFAMFYREGMLRELRATQGTLTLSSVTDSLITGRFDVILRGTVANLNVEDGTAEVHAVGRFRADKDLGGYVIGL